MARTNTSSQRAIQQSGQDLTIAMDSVFKIKEPDADVFFARDLELRYGMDHRKAQHAMRHACDTGKVERAGKFIRNGKYVTGYRVKGKS